LHNYNDVFADYGHVTESQANDPAFSAARRRLHYQGDACEKISLVRHTLDSVPFPDADTVACASAGGCEVSWNSAIDYTLSSGPQLKSGAYGFRFCKCDVPDLKSAFGRKACDQASSCPFAGQYFSVAGQTGWLSISLPDQNGTLQKGGFFGGQFGSLTLNGAGIQNLSKNWDIRLDKAALEDPTAGPTNPTFYRTRGILWGHAESSTAADQKDQQGDIGPDPAYPIPYIDRSNVYSNGSVSLQVTPKVSSPPAPFPPFGHQLIVGPAWNYCPSCPVGFKIPFLDLQEGPGPLDGRVFAVTGQSRVDITDFVPLSIRQTLGATTGTRVFASEPASVLEHFSTQHWTAVALSDSLSLDQVMENGPGGLQVRSGRAAGGGVVAPTAAGGLGAAVATSALATSPTATLPPVEGSFLVAMATRNTVARVGGLVDGKPNPQLHWLDVSTGLWSSNDLVGEHPGRVLAATYRFSDRSLYVVDEKKGKKHEARLLRIRRNGVVELVASWPRILGAEVTLSVSAADELVFSFSNALGHAILVVEVSASGHLSPQGFMVKTGKLLAAPHLSEGWLTEYVQQGLTRKVRDIPRQEFVTSACSFHLGWW
jgi:hypothetical protein